MRKYYHISITVISMISLVLLIVPVHNTEAQIIDKSILEKLKNADRSEFRYIPKKPGHYTKQDWRAVIDSTWGQGMSTAKKLQLFDYCWDLVDQTYPSFFHIHDNWDSLKTVYRPEVAAGVSRGRFCAIMNHMVSNLMDWHTSINDMPISGDTLRPGIPLFTTVGVISMYTKMYFQQENCHFGASLAPLPDSTVFVYDVIQNHPLGLEPGDIILGYDNIPWKQLYKELIAAELPIIVATLGSTPSCVMHGLLTAAGENWHLFDTIDILKYASGDTLHLPTSLLAGQQMQLLTSDQLPIPGVPFPDLDNGHFVSWGIVDGTQTGYIYVWSWRRNGDLTYPTVNAGDEFVQALQILINDYQIDGLIIDSRFNAGGFTFEYLKPLSVFFNEDQGFLEFVRDDPNDHYSMQRIYNNHFKVIADSYLFDRPIAMLTGPYSLSCGDCMPMQMRTHPMVRTFGLGTNGAFGKTSHPDISSISNDWMFLLTFSNLKMADQPNLFLTHLNITPDEELWLAREDAVRGEDTVVKRALEWIGQMIYALNVKPGSTFYQPRLDTLNITAKVANPDNHNINVAVLINTLDSVLVDSVSMFDDGNHGDSLAADGLYGAFIPPLISEDTYTISASTTDLDSAHYHILPRVTRFTTIGPVVLDKLKITSSDTIPHHNDNLKFEFTL
ncbi:S41 family peptidase, partial [Calditrichota bacterium]